MLVSGVLPLSWQNCMTLSGGSNDRAHRQRQLTVSIWSRTLHDQPHHRRCHDVSHSQRGNRCGRCRRRVHGERARHGLGTGSHTTVAQAQAPRGEIQGSPCLGAQSAGLIARGAWPRVLVPCTMIMNAVSPPIATRRRTRWSSHRGSSRRTKGVRGVGLLGQYSNPDNVARLERILAGARRDRPSTRTVRSPRRISDLVGLRRDGWEIDVLAKRFGIGRSTVLDHLKRAGVTGRRWPGRTLSADQLEEADRLYETGLNLIAVAEQFDVDRRYLQRALPEAGFPLRRAGQQERRSA